MCWHAMSFTGKFKMCQGHDIGNQKYVLKYKYNFEPLFYYFVLILEFFLRVFSFSPSSSGGSSSFSSESKSKSPCSI